jgi:hypothetical protein
MKLEYSTGDPLSKAAEDLVDFDMASIKQVVAASHGRTPEIWLVDSKAYEHNGRALRDSESARLLGYSPQDRILYATDGCNSCTRRLNAALENLTDSQLQALAEDNEIRLDLLERLAAAVRE